MSTTCDQFRELLIELAYDELDASTTDSLTHHASTCDECAQELEQIQLTRIMASQLPEINAPDSFDSAIQRLAQIKAEEMIASETLETAIISDTAPQHTGSVVQISDPPLFMERLHALLFKPAFATAGVAAAAMLVAVFVYTNQPDQLSAITEDAAPFAGPSTPVSTAKSESWSNSPTNGPKPASKAPAAPAINKNNGDTINSQDAGMNSNAKSMRLRATKGTPTDGPTPKNFANELGQDKEISPGPISRKAKKSAPPTYSSPLLEREDSLAELSAGAPLESEALVRDERKASKQKSRPNLSSPSAPDSVYYENAKAHYQTGMAAYNRGDCSNAVESFQKVVDQKGAPGLIPSSLHHIAKCEKRTGRCGKALISYENLIRNYPTYNRRPDVLWESAACHRRLGHKRRAEQLLKELALNPEWEDKASGELQSIHKN